MSHGIDTSYNVLGHPVVRLSDLLKENGGGTRWERLVAVPDDDDDTVLVRMWWMTGAICLFVAVFVSVVFIAILRSPLAMKFSFNVYLLALMIPDIVHTSQSALVWWLSAATGEYVSARMCMYQSWFTMFGLGGNSWINAIIAYELWVSDIYFVFKQHDFSCRKRTHRPTVSNGRRGFVLFRRSA
jgi:hypothetical protein